MNRVCDKALRCTPDPDDPVIGFQTVFAPPAVPSDTGIVWGNPDANIGFGNPDALIAFGIPLPQCRSIRCPGDDFLNFSSECDDVDYLPSHALRCSCLGDFTSLVFKAPGIGPFTWTVDNLPEGLAFTVDRPCTGILAIFGTMVTPGRYVVTVTVTDGFGNLTIGFIQFNVLQILTTDIPPATIGSPYSQQLQAIGGSGNFAWKIAAGALAPGLVLHANGLIDGTPTDAFPPQVTLEVIDTECETPDSTFYPPYVTLAGASVTTTAKIIGFPGFVGGVPPKAYRTVTWSGFVTNGNGLTHRDTNLNYCGSTSVDLTGTPISSRIEQGYYKQGAGAPITLNGPCMFGNVLASGIISASFGVTDLAFFNGPSVANRDTVYGLVGESGYTAVVSDVQAKKVGFGSVGPVLWSVDRIVTLSDEFTDADALAAASIAIGTSLAAMSLPRTTGWVSTWTTVQFTLSCHNLMTGQAYDVTVELLSSVGGTTTLTYNFTATGPDHDIVDNIPTPPDGQWILARNPAINLA